MKTLKLITLLLIFVVSIVKINSQSYNPFGYTCEEVPNPPPLTQPLIGGQYKPESIERYTSENDAIFPVLVLFVQFQNDSGPNVDYWMSGQNPTFFKNIISGQKRTSESWWDAYNESTETLSDFWMEASRGDFHVWGKSFSIILPHDNAWYKQNYGTNGHKKINDDIYYILQTQYQDSLLWTDYDKWSKSGGTFVYQRDGYVDMIYKVFRSHNPGLGMPAGGIAMLYDSYSQGSNYLIYNQGGTQIYVNGGFNEYGSGLTITPGHWGSELDDTYGRYAPINKMGTVSFSEHEHGHYLFGSGHMKYGKMMGYLAEYGLDEFLSPYESLLMGYMTSRAVDFDESSYTLYDYSSRNSSSVGEVLEVPINESNEFFLIVNRMKVSYYDKIMWGDTCHDDPYRNINADYGKGLYIYHANPGNSGYPYGANMDQECADGMFNWSFVGYEHPDWSNDQNVEYYTRTSVVYDYNDNGGGGLSNHDGKSLYNWFGIGKKHLSLYGDGTDRIYTNENEVWTSREWKGDRWDAWRLDYNVIFSPYSSPSTVNWANQETGIFIYLESTDGNTANLKIYKVGENNLDEDEILALTPPSRPMGLELTYTECIDGKSFPVLTWHHNMEKDMKVPPDPVLYQFKRYKIFRATTEISGVPDDYEEIADTSLRSDLTPTFIDYDAYLDCEGGLPVYNYQVRYKIRAVDKDELESVYSDFAATPASIIQKQGGNFVINPNSTPAIFSLSQNYPNPFNPTSSIKYTIPCNGYVTLKVYNLLGKEIANLVGEYKEAGEYSAIFDGSNLASGVYFYKLEMGNYSAVKKMVLIK